MNPLIHQTRTRNRWSWSLLIAAVATWAGCSYTTPEMRIEHDPAKRDFHTAFLSAPAKPASPGRPNVVLIMADDLGKTDISLYGGKNVQTKNIDAIGKGGVTFTQGYITSPICSPSRAGMITGRYQQRFGYEYQPHDRYPKNGFEAFFYDKFLDTKTWDLADQKEFPDFEGIMQQGLPPGEFTLAELLKKHGYSTAVIGKWHLGTEAHTQPNARGFDYQFGFYEAFTLYHPDLKNPNIVNQKHDNFSDKWIWKQQRNGNCALRCNNVVIEDSVYLTDRLADEAVKYIQRDHKKPFFLYVPFLAPHTPFQAKKEDFDQFAHEPDRNKRVYYAMIKSLDDAVGRIIEALESSGQAENTMIWFLSDNGGATYTHATENYPLKGGKFTNFEGGLNVPFMLKWASKIRSGKIYDRPVVSMDIFQTVADIAEIELPSDRKYDGVNLLPFINDLRNNDPHEALFWRSHYAWAVRKGNWKLVCDELSGNRVLYDLGNDPYEKNNLIKSQTSTYEELKAQFDRWDAEAIPPLWPRVMDFRFETPDGIFHFPL